MPDTKLTWSNFKEHLRKCGVIYLVVMVAVAAVSSFVWTATTPRIPEDQRVLIYLADAMTGPEALNELAPELLQKAQEYDPNLQEITFESLLFIEGDYTGTMLLMTRLAAGEGDLFLAGPAAFKALVQSGACLPLDQYRADGWLSGLEDAWGEYTNSDTEETTQVLAGVKLDPLTALYDMRAFQNEGGALVVASNGTNVDTSMKVAELLVDMLSREVAPDA